MAILGVAVAAAVVLFTFKTTTTPVNAGGWDFYDASKVHPVWATIAGFGFLLGGLVAVGVIVAMNRR